MTEYVRKYNERHSNTKEAFWKRIEDGKAEQEKIKKTMEYLERLDQITKEKKNIKMTSSPRTSFPRNYNIRNLK